MFELHPDSSTPLVNQIIDGLRELIDNQTLKPGAKVPSIRAFAASYSVSTFTVVEAARWNCRAMATPWACWSCVH